MGSNILKFVQDFAIILYKNIEIKFSVLEKGVFKRAFLILYLLIVILINPALGEGIEEIENYEYYFNAYKNVVKYYNPKLSDNESNIITDTILRYSWHYGIDARLIVSLIVCESRFRPYAVSHKGAMGLGQLMPGTARKLGVRNPFDLRENIIGSIRYLREQYDRWSSYGRRAQDLALASYNAGPEAVAQYGGIPPYNETINYVRKVKNLYIRFGGKWYD